MGLRYRDQGFGSIMVLDICREGFDFQDWDSSWIWVIVEFLHN